MENFNLYRNKKKKKKKETRKTAKCDTIALFTFNENPWAGFLSSMHFWLSFWLRFFFRGLPFRQKYKKKSQETIPCRDGNNDGRSTGQRVGEMLWKGSWKLGWEQTRTHLLVRRAERDWAGEQIRGDYSYIFVDDAVRV